jgi:nuclear pore complex protein Nup205
MSELRALEARQALHGELVAVRQHRYEGLQALEELLDAQSDAFKKLLDKPPRNSTNRAALGSGMDRADARHRAKKRMLTAGLREGQDWRRRVRD